MTDCVRQALYPASFIQYATSLLLLKRVPSSLSKPIEKSGLSFSNLSCLLWINLYPSRCAEKPWEFVRVQILKACEDDRDGRTHSDNHLAAL